MNQTADLYKIRALVYNYLKSRDVEGFGCACIPTSNTFKCGTCTEADNQKPLAQALKLLDNLTSGMVVSEESAYMEASCETIPPMALGSIGRWWFNKGYRHADHSNAVVWREVVLDELVSLGAYAKKHDADPKLALKDAITFNIDMAFDPAISQVVKDKLARSYNTGYFIGHKEGYAEGVLKAKGLDEDDTHYPMQY